MRSTRTMLPLLALLAAGCAQHQLTMADKARDRMAYAQAAPRYERYLAQRADRGAALRAADAYGRMNDAAMAAHWYAAADRMAPLQGADAAAMGRMLQVLGRTDEAARYLEAALAENPEDPLIREMSLAIAGRDAFFVDTALYQVDPLRIDGVSSAFSAVPMGGRLLFAAERDGDAGRRNPWNGAAFLDLFTAPAAEPGQAVRAEPLPGAVNGRFHDGPAALSPDGRTMYFTRSDYYRFRLNKDEQGTSHLMLFRAELQPDGRWGGVSSFAYNGEDFSAGHAALSADGSTLYYISDMPGGFGGTDIYACQRTEEGWGYPRNLGPEVNTPGNEMFPSLCGDTLYFASNGHRTLGGLDIFRSVRSESGWSAPENLNYPINTSHDDFALFTADGLSGYLSSNRGGPDGIYRFSRSAPVLALEAIVVDADGGRPVAGIPVALTDAATGERTEALTDGDGRARFPLAADRRYEVLVSREGSFAESRPVSTVGQRISRTYTERFELRRIVPDEPMAIESIYYDLDRWDIRPDAAAELDKIAQLIIDNPHLSFELSSHTDSRASAIYNLLLSEARARSAVDYLVRRGAPPERITARGYGEERLVNRCADGVECSEQEHQQNRRTEFKVVKVLPPLSEQR